MRHFVFRHLKESKVNSTSTFNIWVDGWAFNWLFRKFLRFDDFFYYIFSFQDIQSEPTWGTNCGSRVFPSSFYSSTVSSQISLPGCTPTGFILWLCWDVHGTRLPWGSKHKIGCQRRGFHEIMSYGRGSTGSGGQTQGAQLGRAQPDCIPPLQGAAPVGRVQR